MKINKLSLPVTILIASIVLGGFVFAAQVVKQKSIEKQQQAEIESDKLKTAETDPVNTTPPPSSLPPKAIPAIDPEIKVEECKTSATIKAKAYVQEVFISRSKSMPPVGCDTGNTDADANCVSQHLLSLLSDSDYLQATAYNQAYLSCLKN
jgi:hypothetical protein